MHLISFPIGCLAIVSGLLGCGIGSATQAGNKSGSKNKDSLFIVNMETWAGATSTGQFKNIAYTYPKDWKIQVIDSLGKIQPDNGKVHHSYKLSFFPVDGPGLDIIQYVSEDFSKEREKLIRDVHSWVDGHVNYRKDNSLSGLPSFDLEYEWKDADGKVTYKHFERQVEYNNLVFRFIYGGLNEGFLDHLAEAFFIIEKCKISGY